jgi:hypothetical protein
MAGLQPGTYLVIVDIGEQGPTVGSLTPLGKLESWHR